MSGVSFRTPSQFDSTIGAVLVGTFFDVYLMGIVATQVFHYYRTFPADRLLFRYVVGFMLFVSLFHSIAAMAMAYNWSITSYGNARIIEKAQLAFTLDVPIDGIAAFFCQCFFAERVWLISGKKRIIPSIILALTSIQLGFSIGAIIMEYKLDLLFDRFQEWEYGVIVWSLSAVLADVLITFSLVLYLRQNKSDYESTNSIVEKLLRLTVQTNALTMLLAIACVVSFAVVPDLYGVIPQFSLAKSYFISLLASINARASLKQQLETSNTRFSPHTSSANKKTGLNSRRIYSPRGTGNSGLESNGNTPPGSPVEFPAPIRVNITETIHVDEMDDLDKEALYPTVLRIRAPPAVPSKGLEESINHAGADNQARRNW